MSYSCIYEDTIFYNPQNKHSIIRVRTKDNSIPNKARKATNSRDDFIRFVAKGYNLPQTSKISMVLEGEWETSKYGTQLNVETCEEIVPHTDEGMKGYLSSCLVKGIGEVTAEEIIKRFGADTLNIIENEPERLLEIKGISEQKLEDIKRTFNESYSVRSLMILLSPYNISPATAIKIYDYFGAKSIDILSENPYRLCELSGFGFKRVDAIVKKGDTPLNSPMRIRGAINTALDKEQQENGHLFIDEKTLLQTAAEMLNEELPSPDKLVKSSEIDVVIDDMILKGDIVSNEGRIYSTKTFIMEYETAEKVAKLISMPPLSIDISSILEHVRKNVGIALSQRQSEAVYMAFKSNLSIITGSPGTGKTTVLKAIIEVFKTLNPNGKIKLAAPTGRASRRMAESTGQDDASTLHSMLGLQSEDGYFNKDKEFEPLDADLIIVDESSMIDMWLARQFFIKVKPTTRVILVGDVDQLQSVGAGDVFRELINCGLIPVTILDQIFRQEAGSRIAINAKAINNDQTKLSYGDDFNFYKCKTQDQAADIIQRVFCDLVKVHGIENVQILSPNRKKGSAATNQLNPAIRELVNPYKGGLPDLKVGSSFFRVGDKVMQNKNCSKASNGDIGFIRDIGVNADNETVITIEFAADRKEEYSMEDMKHIELAYATTVHKAMGSEYDIVIMPIISSHYPMLKRNLIYTGITRAKHRVVLIGQVGMLCMAIHRNETGNRNTALGERIANYKKVYDIKKEELKKVS